jgi:hypothetical protein
LTLSKNQENSNKSRKLHRPLRKIKKTQIIFENCIGPSKIKKTIVNLPENQENPNNPTRKFEKFKKSKKTLLGPENYRNNS